MLMLVRCPSAWRSATTSPPHIKSFRASAVGSQTVANPVLASCFLLTTVHACMHVHVHAWIWTLCAVLGTHSPAHLQVQALEGETGKLDCISFYATLG